MGWFIIINSILIITGNMSSKDINLISWLRFLDDSFGIYFVNCKLGLSSVVRPTLMLRNGAVGISLQQ
jgi:hypothetical protein